MGTFTSETVGIRVTDLPPKHAEILKAGALPDPTTDVAVIAAWSSEGELSKSNRALVEQLLGYGYLCCLVVATDHAVPVTGIGKAANHPDFTLIRRDNIGYDFGSWATALRLLPEIKTARRTLLLNDSLVGPFASLKPLLNSFGTSNTDVWGMCESSEITPHLQSFCIGYNNGVLSQAPLEEFWNGIESQPTKEELILRYEVGQTNYLREHSYSIQAMFPIGSLVLKDRNPSQFGWRKILDAGIPMVKRELIKHPQITKDSSTIPAELDQRFGIDVTGWV